MRQNVGGETYLGLVRDIQELSRQVTRLKSQLSDEKDKNQILTNMLKEHGILEDVKIYSPFKRKINCRTLKDSTVVF